MLITSFHYDYYLRLRGHLFDDGATTEDLAYYLSEIYILFNIYLTHPDALFSDGNYSIQGKSRKEVSLQREYLINEFRVN